ncbi:hypothetical protein G9C98_003844 [Cotesia typhae]|uniref:Uncharacterized protein n=1 Tax=Cotesia typhae TaxID=2053667 RepID=A0A8J5QUY6_9HYME|nr:hypothetical protein G9C98_003844 [Cotesia typhae]
MQVCTSAVLLNKMTMSY